MLTEIEKQIFIRIEYSDRLLQIWGKYLDNGNETPIIRVPEIKNQFKQLSGFNYHYAGEGSHQLSKNIEELEVKYNFIISQNMAEVLFLISKNGKNIGLKYFNVLMPLRFIPYDETLIRNNSGFNSVGDLMSFVKEIAELLDEVVKEYIIEIKNGNFVIT